MEKIQEHKQAVLEQLQTGITSMLKKNKVTIYQGHATILSDHTVHVASSDPTLLTADNILICTGSSPAMPPIPGIDLPGVVNSDALLENKTIYKKLIIIGGGVIGMEFASIYQNLGTEVIVIEALDRILANMDKEFSQSLKMLMKKRGVEIHTSALVNGIQAGVDGSLLCTFEEKSDVVTREADGILIATGRKPNTEGLFGDDILPVMERGRICVNEHFETSIPHIYAAGDVIGGIQLAHVASAEATNAVSHILGETPPYCLSLIPSCVYTSPEIASVGITPDEAKTKNLTVHTVKYPMSANGKSVLSCQERGYIKITADSSSGKILGAQMMSARATDMISIFSQAIANGLTIKQMSSVIYPHPTFSEGIGEALRLF
jgi:dihydrolipoamide dehydrogenase